MPNLEEHCKHSEKRYGVRGEDIHSWMDETSQIAGKSHRKYRHDLKSIPIAIQIFGAKYGADVVENIFLDHLKADSEESRKLAEKANLLSDKTNSKKYRLEDVSEDFKNSLKTAEDDHTIFHGAKIARGLFAFGLALLITFLLFIPFDSGSIGVRQNWYYFIGLSFFCLIVSYLFRKIGL